MALWLARRAPASAAASSPCSRPRRLLGLTGKAVAAHVLPAVRRRYGTDWHSVVERSFWAQADLFAFGMVAAVLHVEVADGRITLPAHWPGMAVLAALLVFVPCAWTMQLGEHSFLLQNTGEALALALVLRDRRPRTPGDPSGLGSQGARVAGVRGGRRRVLQPVPLALPGDPVAARAWANRRRPGRARIQPAAGGGRGRLSALTYRYVERPALRHELRGRRADRRRGTGHDRTRRSASTSRRRRLGQSAVASFRRSLPGVSPASTSMRGSASRSAPRRTVPARTVNATA